MIESRSLAGIREIWISYRLVEDTEREREREGGNWEEERE